MKSPWTYKLFCYVLHINNITASVYHSGRGPDFSDVFDLNLAGSMSTLGRNHLLLILRQDMLLLLFLLLVSSVGLCLQLYVICQNFESQPTILGDCLGWRMWYVYTHTHTLQTRVHVLHPHKHQSIANVYTTWVR